MQKIFFKLFTGIHVFLYRLTGGKFGGEMRGFNVLLLNTVGNKSGKQRTSPLGYVEHDGGYVIAASAGGSDQHPGWYFNLKSKPQTSIQVQDREINMQAEITQGALRSQLWQQLITEAPAYADYEKATDREIPLILLRPAVS